MWPFRKCFVCNSREGNIEKYVYVLDWCEGNWATFHYHIKCIKKVERNPDDYTNYILERLIKLKTFKKWEVDERVRLKKEAKEK